MCKKNFPMQIVCKGEPGIVARMLLVAKGIPTRSKKLLVAPGITTRNKKLLLARTLLVSAPCLTTRRDRALKVQENETGT